MRVAKAWGYEEVLVNEPEYCAKILNISPGKKCSLHYHKTKKETFFIQSGLVRLEQAKVIRPTEFFQITRDELLKFDESRTIEPMTPHRFSSTYGATILEISTHHDDADVVRLEPSGDL